MKRKIGIALLIGFLAGILWLIAIRFISYEDDSVHYHANFALYTFGRQVPFEGFGYYEEVQSCSGDHVMNPRTRVHMHDSINHVIHVHDTASTWGHFFANLGYTLGNNLLQTPSGTYLENEEHEYEIRFILNGEEVDNIANLPIQSKDALLIDISQDSDEELQKRYAKIQKDAAEYNSRQDPPSCAGGKPLTFTERLKKAIGVF